MSCNCPGWDIKCGFATVALQNAFYSSNSGKTWQREKADPFYLKGPWHWRGFWLSMSFTILYTIFTFNNIPTSGASRAWEMIVVKFKCQKVSWGYQRSPLPLLVCPVLCSQLRVGPEPCQVLSATAVCAAFGFILLLRSTLAVMGMASFPASFQPHLTSCIRGRPIRCPHASRCPLWWDKMTLSRRGVEMKQQLGSPMALLSEEDEQHLQMGSWVCPASLQAHFTLYCCSSSCSCCTACRTSLLVAWWPLARWHLRRYWERSWGTAHPEADIVTMTTLMLWKGDP